jgi:Zn-dependent M28 family amino/carboxypeptidase
VLHLPRTMALLLVLVGLSALLAGGSASAQTPAQPGRAEIVAQLPRSISLARMRADLGALERIADRNGGNRAAGTPGYAASVRYVVAQLRRAGYRPQVTAFPYVEYLEHLERGRQITPVQRELPLEALQYSPSTPQGGIRARVVSSGDGCSAGDFGAVRGRIALVERGTCFFSAKAANAQAARAVGVLVFNNEEGALDGTLGGPSASEIPVAGITRGLGRELAAAPNAVVELELVTQTRQARSQNITTDTRPAPRVLVVGAHLDSVRDGPGINDNATGVAALLEIARALNNRSNELAVRFAFWGAEELGLFGSRAYARTVQRERVTGYLNFDVLGSPSQRYGVYGVDRFAERWLGYLERRGMNAVRTGIGGRSDHAAFAQRGIPVGGLFAGGYACYHRACDRLANVDLGTLEDLASAAAYGVASFAPLAR